MVHFCEREKHCLSVAKLMQEMVQIKYVRQAFAVKLVHKIVYGECGKIKNFIGKLMHEWFELNR